MTIEKVKEITKITSQILDLEKKIDFVREGRYQDEFVLGYSPDGKAHDYNSIEISPEDVEFLREFWKNKIKQKLSELGVK